MPIGESDVEGMKGSQPKRPVTLFNLRPASSVLASIHHHPTFSHSQPALQRMARTRLQKSTTDYFSKLSPEILRCMFAYFCPHCCNEYQCPFGAPPELNRVQDNTTLYNLCLVSRYFRPFAQEILHHSFDPYYTSWDAPNPWERRLEPFLQTIASRPDLARSVKQCVHQPSKPKFGPLTRLG
ncbi:Uncharacterized protein HZ326_19429 [Fusarium oxysporum f. sp. albedinis]|nr:Uncharacterized protein HZ326_19429 [Fusarium oxysporum f. sp. albedinis]